MGFRLSAVAFVNDSRQARIVGRIVKNSVRISAGSTQTQIKPAGFRRLRAAFRIFFGI